MNGFQHVIFPLTDVTYDSGKSTLRWKNFYSSAFQSLDSANRSNYVTLTAAITGANPTFRAAGASDTNIGIDFLPLGTGAVRVASSALTVTTGAVTVNSTLAVTGATTLAATSAGALSVSGAITPSADAADALGTTGLRFTNLFLSGTIQTAASTMGITQKKGSGGGDYSTTSASYVDVDSTNLAFTVTIPSGWKLWVTAKFNYLQNTAAAFGNIGILDGSIIAEETLTTTVVGARSSGYLQAVITGDGASHTVKLQFKTGNVSDAFLISNSNSTQTAFMSFLLLPSN